MVLSPIDISFERPSHDLHRSGADTPNLERARALENIEWLSPYVVEELLPGEGGSLSSARLRNTSDGSSRELEIANDAADYAAVSRHRP